MIGIANRLAFTVPAILAPLVITTAVSPAVSKAAECGEGTVYDAPSDTCVVAQSPPPQYAPPPPAWGGWYGPGPYVSIGICAPIPFVQICAGI